MKPGYKTTEMWGAGTVAIIISEVMQKSEDWKVLCVGCAALAVVSWAYMHSRTTQKAAVTPDA